MNEGTNEYPLANVDVRRKTGIDRSPLDEIKAIRTLLADVYKDAGDGRTLFRELVQNADDAGAERLRLTVLERGWLDARNSLLHGPALLVANDGPFPDKDRNALHKAIGGSKEDDASKIGTFGIGLKSVFHICEAFLYIGAEKSAWLAGVMNPWTGTGDNEDADPLHPDWNAIGESKFKRLKSVTMELLRPTSNGLLLWIPLRRPKHLDRGAEGGQYGLGERCPEPKDLCDWFGNPAPAALLLAQCGHLKSIKVDLTTGLESLHDRSILVRVARQTTGWVGRHENDSPKLPNRAFEGTIASDERNWSVVGIEALGSNRLDCLRSQPGWPQETQSHDGRHSTVPRKGLAHAAITVLRLDAPNAKPLGTRLRWAAFLTLDDDPEPRSSVIVECHGSSPAWEIILHGYFWPSQDRRSIPGVTDDPNDGADDTGMRNRWNRAVCSDLLLPLLPSALVKAVDKVEEPVAQELLNAVVKSKIVRNHSNAVKRRHWLLPMVAADGVRWEARNAKECRVMSIPNWRQAPEVVYRQFVAFCDECRDGVVFIDDDAPRLAGELDDWTVEHLEPLLNSIPNDAFAAPQELKWIRQVVRHILGEGTNGGDNRAVSVARWIAERIGEKALDPTTRRVSDESQRNAREELRCTWRDLLAALPKEWLLDAPLESQQAVAELATEEMIGEGLIPVPFGRELEPLPSQPDPDRLDSALRVLGRRLAAGGESERLRHSRLLLAETLLSVRDTNRPLNDLETLPLLRTTKMPEEREEAWSVCKLRCQTDTYRVFANPPPVRDSDVHQPERLSDPKQAVKELAAALDEDVWFLIDAGVAALAGTPPPTPDALAGAVSGAKTFHPEPVKRKHLVDRLVQDGGPHVCAVRALLAGRTTAEVGQDTELFFAPRQSVNQQTLDILLRLLGQSWRAVDVELVEVLSQNRIQDLSVSPADARALHRLLNDCLNETVDWAGLSDEEALHLLQHLYGGMAEDQERWRAMPLHRDVDGKRGPLNDRSLRKTEGSDELPLPPELAVTVRLLDPDPSVAHLYASVPVMARDGVLRLMLEDDRPWRFTQQILNSVRSIEGQMTLPRDSELRDLLRHRCWLPHRDGGGFAPDAVLIAPKELQKEVVGLAAAGAFGDKRIPEDVDPGIRQTAEQVIPEILGRLGKHRQVQRIADALNPDQVAQVKGGVYLVMPDPEIVDASLIEDALKTTLADSHLGWKLVNTVERVLGLGHRGGAGLRPASEPLLKLVKALCGPIQPARQIAMLKTLAQSRPAKESPDGRLFRKLLDRFAKTDEFFKSVLSEIELPTQDGNWHASQGVARSESGVARRHRLISELRPSLRLSGDDPVPQTNNVGSGESENESDALEALDNYFEPWRDRLPPGAVGAFLSLLGNGFRGGIAKLAQQWLGDNVSLEGLRTQLASPNGSVPCSDVSVWVNPDVARGDGVSAMNVVGSWVEMEVDAGNETLFAFDPEPRPASQTVLSELGPFWEITLRDVEPQSRTQSDLTGLLGNTVERWAVQFLKLDRDMVKAWWSRWGAGSQADLGPVLASIRAHLPLTLRQLDVQEREPLREALREAEQAQRKREQTPTEATLKAEREALDGLAKLIEEPEHQTFLWERVNELMRRYGYEAESVLLELAQNADDALAQAAEIKGGPLPPATCRLSIRVHEHDGTPTVDITHWGRPINDTGGAAFPEGRERQWDQDLYFMMLMNLSGKRGEAPEGAAPSSTTGRFGLGFKSVHLVSSSPSVVSGFIGFSIAGGLLPQERPVADDADSQMVEDCRATRVRLPLRRDVEARTLIERLFHRFAYARALLPVFARQLREVVVEGDPFSGVHVFDGKPIDGAPGWSVGAKTELHNHDGHWRVLRFRPADAGHEEMGTAALAIGLQEGVPTAFGPEMPFLWNVAPTSESWGCGYAVNGPFKLDPGRTHVSLDDGTTLRAADGLGEALGKGLIQLHDALVCSTDEVRRLLDHGDGRSFLTSLWKVLASGLNNPDKLRRGFLLRLHGNDHGLSAWMAARPAVPTGLPAPFPAVLPPLTSGTRVEVAGRDLGNADFCHALAEIDDGDLAGLVEARCIVSAENQVLLRPLCQVGTGINTVPLRPSDLLRELVERWGYCLTPDRLHALRPIAGDAAWEFVSSNPQGAAWRGKLKARSADGSFQPLRNLLLPEAPGSFDGTDAEGKDELLRAAFAPENRKLDPAYIENGKDWKMFQWLRVQHRVDAERMAKWYGDLRENRRPAAVSYLLHGNLAKGVLSYLVAPDARPPWLQEYDYVHAVLEELGEEPWRCQSLLGALFPDRFRPPEPPQPPDEPERFFERLLEWWDDDAERSKVIADYERRAWPTWLRKDGMADRLTADSQDHWLAFLVLGACQSLGRTRDEQHRRFIELAHDEGWWDVFKAPDDDEAWMSVLRRWQDQAVAEIEYRLWMSLFPAIYQLSRYQDVYVRLLKSAGRRPDDLYQVTRLLSPRADEALTGAGTHFDAPPAPLNMGLHWVLRELVRLGVVQGEHLHPDCWVPSEQVLGFLQPLGLEQPDGGLPNSQKAHAIANFLADELGTNTPTLHLAFDIPLRHIAENEELRRGLGLER